MNENSVQKCRTCLKSSEKTFPLTKYATGCNPGRTYGQLLKEYAYLECIPDYERFMPQFLCLLCCRGLRNTYAFIKQAQYCNNKLVNVISNKLDCLQERTIDLPEDENDLEKYLGIKVERNVGDCHTLEQKEKDSKIDEFSLECSNGPFEESKDNDTADHNEDIEEMGIIDNERNDSDNLQFGCLMSDNNKKIANLKNHTEGGLIDTICPICRKIISRRDNLIKHMRTEHDIENPSKIIQNPKTEEKEVFACKFCSSNYTNKYTYLYHLKLKHNIAETKRKGRQLKDKVIKCRSCDYICRTYAALNYHTRSKHGTEKDKFKCKFCTHLYLQKFDLLTHVKNSHKELIKTLKAEAGNKGESLSDTNTLTSSKLEPGNIIDKNEETSSDDNIPLIKKNYKSHSTSNSHTKMEEDMEHFSDEEFIRNMLNIKKRQRKSSTKSLARRCDECGNIYKNYKALYAHQRHVHISEDKYSLCPHCGKKYKRRTDLRIHIEKNHMPKNSTPYTKQPAKVREKRFMCNECSYVCTTITILNIHINRHHTGEKPYKCDICFKSFIVPYDMKIHRYLHTGERPYKCPVCSKGFRDNSHMIKHKRIHSSERPYKCRECAKSFAQSYNLSVHKRTHLKEKKLNCVVCGKVFENRSLLNMHRINEDHHDDI